MYRENFENICVYLGLVNVYVYARIFYLWKVTSFNHLPFIVPYSSLSVRARVHIFLASVWVTSNHCTYYTVYIHIYINIFTQALIMDYATRSTSISHYSENGTINMWIFKKNKSKKQKKTSFFLTNLFSSVVQLTKRFSEILWSDKPG